MLVALLLFSSVVDAQFREDIEVRLVEIEPVSSIARTATSAP
jgi:hypothetical protein